MPIYEFNNDDIQPIEITSFQTAGFLERQDMQRLLKNRIDAVVEDTLIISEEFGEFDESQRRIDLLGIDKDANIVVIELKRAGSAHMELQAVRYAAMVANMTFQRAVEIYSEYLLRNESAEDAHATLLDHLEWDEPEEDRFAQDVRIVLVAENFSRELTTAVLWLNDRGLNIQCVRLQPYTYRGHMLVDIQREIPLPGAEEYQVQIREKQQQERKQKTRQSRKRFDVIVPDQPTLHDLTKRHAILRMVQALVNAGVSPEDIAARIPWRKTNLFIRVPKSVGTESFEKHVSQIMAEQGKAFDARRWFLGDERIEYDGTIYAFTNQWGKRTEEAMNTLANAFADKGVNYKESIADEVLSEGQ